MKVIGINYSDTNYRRGFRMHAAVSLPLIPGHEGAGIVVATGEGVANVKVRHLQAEDAGAGGVLRSGAHGF